MLSLNSWQFDMVVTRLTSSRWGWSILIGGLLGLSLTCFHFIVEHRLEPHVLAAREEPDSEAFALIIRRLRIIPRAGLGVLLLTFLMMMIAARGL